MADTPGEKTLTGVSWVDYSALGVTFELNEEASCEICGCKSSLFKDYLGRPKTLCGHCGAAERQRVLAKLYREFIQNEYPLSGKRILSIGPAASEKTLLRSMNPAEILFIDIRPDTSPDRIVDICNMPEIVSGSFDAVIASGVLSFVHDLDAALSEIHRVLSEGGIFLHTEVNFGLNQRTEEVNDPEKTSAWYGRKTLEEKRVGLFRKLGDLDFIAALQRDFVVKMYYGRDSANGTAVVWQCAVKRSDIVLRSAPAPSAAAAAPRLFVTPLPDGFPGARAKLELSVPAVPQALTYTNFAEHVVSPSAGVHGEVILLGKGVIGVSRDSGHCWEVIKPEGLNGIDFDQCFTTQAGMHIVQAAGWGAENELRANPDEWGRIFVFDAEWRLVADNKLGDSSWHGTMSIDENSGVLMFAGYPANLALFYPEKRLSALTGGPEGKFLRPSRVHRSLDGGATWHVVFEMPPAKIRHFHSIVADPFEPETWWLSSGDLPEECRIWRTRDHGGAWEDVTDPAPELRLPARFSEQRQSCHRLTCMAVGETALLWGGDDIMAPYWTASHADFVKNEAGAWLYSSPKTSPLKVTALAYLGQPARSMIDVGTGWIITSEATRGYSTLAPRVHYAAKRDPGNCVEIARLSNHAARGTGLSYSRASRTAADGVFFSFRLPTDEFEARPGLMRWQFTLE
jgi:SAM-dependent methyltransferase